MGPANGQRAGRDGLGRLAFDSGAGAALHWEGASAKHEGTRPAPSYGEGIMTATTPEPPRAAAPAKPEKPLYVKLPPPGLTHGSRPPTDAAHPVWQGLGTLLAAGLCLSLPLAPATIMALLLIQPSTQRDGLVWLWVSMIV